ncbi:BQ5605_C034g11346 [Microbotryum silenes-dioicae]|uniref:Acyl-protein thioesterase 1 n=1 Tax=Microbotryum silenes-dioicae TaxID=796604 RepID=A0A2X0PHT6_9BASI|nr:BQ5605_C034g11346 [Microbotryum silenes-dioicae]
MSAAGLRLRAFAPTVLAAPNPSAHTASLVFCHGFGATASDWQDLHRLPGLDHLKVILPQAPLRAISINSMQPMPAWFDILSMSHAARTQDGDEDEEGLGESVDDLTQIIQTEIDAGIAPGRIVIGGFSQGAALAMKLGLAGKLRLGGVVALSGYTPLQWKFMLSPWARETPVFVGHGTADSVISFSTGEAGVARLRGAGLQRLEFQTYPGMAHSACLEELQDLTRWLQKVVPSINRPEATGKPKL